MLFLPLNSFGLNGGAGDGHDSGDAPVHLILVLPIHERQMVVVDERDQEIVEMKCDPGNFIFLCRRWCRVSLIKIRKIHKNGVFQNI
jgi:hypothetical protein